MNTNQALAYISKRIVGTSLGQMEAVRKYWTKLELSSTAKNKLAQQGLCSMLTHHLTGKFVAAIKEDEVLIVQSSGKSDIGEPKNLIATLLTVSYRVTDDIQTAIIDWTDADCEIVKSRMRQQIGGLNHYVETIELIQRLLHKFQKERVRELPKEVQEQIAKAWEAPLD